MANDGNGIGDKIELDKSLKSLIKDQEPVGAVVDDTVLDDLPMDDDGDNAADADFDYVAPIRRNIRASDEDGEEEEEVSLWLVTFTDAMALMLTFFVLLYSMSEPVKEDWKEINDGLNRYFGKQQSPEWYEGPQDNIDISKLDYFDALNLNYLASIIADVVQKNDGLENVTLFPQGQNLIISLPQELLFRSGQANVSDAGKQALFSIGGSLANIRNRIEVIGHTDPSPMETDDIRSNWELSLRRAMSVANILGTVGYDRTIITRGLSSARFDELPESWSENQKFDLSRRVDILIMKDDGSRRDTVNFKVQR